MSERLPSSEKTPNTPEQLVSKEQREARREETLEKAREAIEKHAEQDHNEIAKEAVEQAEHAKPAVEQTPVDRDRDLALPGVQQSIKNNAYRRELTKIQSKLPKQKRNFSKIIHNKTIESISNVGAQTAARPSGVLGGSIFAFLGSVTLYYMARHYGFQYNYLMLFLLFVLGFTVGCVLELLVWSLSGRRARRHTK